MLVDTSEFFKCETCRHMKHNGCSLWCESGEMYSPDINKLTSAVPETQSFKAVPADESFEAWLVYTAIGKDHHLINQMSHNSDGSYPLRFEVGGIPLDFHRVAERIESNFDRLVDWTTKEILCKKYGELMSEIDEIQNRIQNQQEMFRYDWEE